MYAPICCSSLCPFDQGLIKQGKTGGFQAIERIRWEVEKDLGREWTYAGSRLACHS